MGLFVLHRPGLLAVNGTITEICSNFVTVKGNVFLPVSRKEVERLARIRYPKWFSPGRMKLKEGENLVAITGDNYGAEALFYGAETAEEVYDLRAYQIRYCGSFDFEERNETEEQHVFAGFVGQSNVVQSPRPMTLTKLIVHSGEKDDVRLIIEDGEIRRRRGDKMVIATGKAIKDNEGVEYYPAIP